MVRGVNNSVEKNLFCDFRHQRGQQYFYVFPQPVFKFLCHGSRLQFVAVHSNYICPQMTWNSLANCRGGWFKIYFDACLEWFWFQIIYFGVWNWMTFTCSAEEIGLKYILESGIKCHLWKTTSLEIFRGSGVSQMSQILQFIANFTALLGNNLGSVFQAR